MLKGFSQLYAHDLVGLTHNNSLVRDRRISHFDLKYHVLHETHAWRQPVSLKKKKIKFLPLVRVRRTSYFGLTLAYLFSPHIHSWKLSKSLLIRNIQFYHTDKIVETQSCTAVTGLEAFLHVTPPPSLPPPDIKVSSYMLCEHDMTCFVKMSVRLAHLKLIFMSHPVLKVKSLFFVFSINPPLVSDPAPYLEC